MEKVTKISLAFLAIVFIAILVLFKKCGKHKTSENEIDKAIAQSIELAKKQELTALSAISPRREDAIISTMRGLRDLFWK